MDRGCVVSCCLGLVCLFSLLFSLMPYTRTNEFATQYANRYSTTNSLGISIVIGMIVSAAMGYHDIGVRSAEFNIIANNSETNENTWCSIPSEARVNILIIPLPKYCPFVEMYMKINTPSPTRRAMNTISENLEYRMSIAGNQPLFCLSTSMCMVVLILSIIEYSVNVCI